jgi:putative exporter of polyketide antibiotics
MISLSAELYPQGGTVLFAVLALAGDVGCSAGPGLVGLVSSAVQGAGHSSLFGRLPGSSGTETGLKAGLLLAVLFPVLMVLGVLALRRRHNTSENQVEI